jgi:hypothetical protein
MPRSFSINLDGGSLTAAVTTVLEFTAPATKSVIVTRAWLSQRSNTTSAQQAVQILRRSTASTAVASGTLSNSPMDAGDSAFGGTSRQLATVLGTAGAILYADSFNWQNGWLWLPVPEERIIVAGAGILSLHLPVAPAALTISCGFDIIELG